MEISNTICKVESATMDDSAYDGFNNLPVQVGAENGKCQVVIGSADTVWQTYSAIRVKDFATYFIQSDMSNWTTGWDIEIGTASGTYADVTNYHYLDYIVERGTEAVNVSGYCNGDWKYTIYNSGRIEAYYNGYLTLTMEVGFSDIYDVYCDNVDGVDICYRVHYQHILHDEINGEIEDTIQTPADKSASVFIDCDITTEDGIRTVFGNGEYTWITPLSEYTPS